MFTFRKHAVDIMMAQAKRIYIFDDQSKQFTLIIKNVNYKRRFESCSLHVHTGCNLGTNFGLYLKMHLIITPECTYLPDDMFGNWILFR